MASCVGLNTPGYILLRYFTISLLVMPPKTRKKSAVNGTAKERIMMKHSSRSLSSLSVKSISLEGDLAHRDSRQDVSNI